MSCWPIVEVTSMHTISTPPLLIVYRVEYKLRNPLRGRGRYCVICTVRQNVKHNIMRITHNVPLPLEDTHIIRRVKAGLRRLRVEAATRSGRLRMFNAEQYWTIYTKTPISLVSRS